MEAIGYNVTAHRIAAYAFAALIAAWAESCMVWLNNQISPFSVGIDVVINLLVIAVVGGLSHPIGPFIGALIYVILRTFTLDALVAVGLDGRRFQTLIGLGFLIIVLFSPDGVIGIWRRLLGRARAPGGRERRVSTIAERMAAAGTGNAIELSGVSRCFGALAALTDITLSVRPGERRAVLGSNGAGKTTLLNCVTGDFPPTSGTVRFFGEDVTLLPPHERIRRGLRRTYQISLLFPEPLRARQRLSRLPRRARAAASRSSARARTDAIMQSVVDLISLVHLEAVTDRLVGELAHGQQRQLEIALALAGAPRFILFDEPAAGLSPNERGDLVAILTALPAPHRLHHHRARHGCRAPRRRERDDDAQRPHLQGRRAARDRSGSGSAATVSRWRPCLSVVPPDLLEIRGLNIFYGRSHALQGVDLRIEHGVLSLVGRNGMGKTTLCKAIVGLLPVASGSIRFMGEELIGRTPAEIARLGLGYVPQGRRLWPSLTVDEHLRLAAGNDAVAMDDCAHLRNISAARRAAQQPRQPALRRRAADARDLARAAAQSAPCWSWTSRPRASRRSSSSRSRKS